MKVKILAFVLAAGVMLCGPALEAQQTLTILKAVYSAGDVQKDVTPYLSAKVQNGQVQLRVGNDTLGGDPSFGKTKTLTVLYQSEGSEFSVTAKEGATLILPNPAALPVAQSNQVSPTQIVSSPPTSSDTVDTAQTTLRHLAPDGIYYLLQRISAVTDSGIIGLPPGTRVQRISEADGRMKVKAGNDEFEVAQSLVTNDLDIAGAVANQDAQTQAAAKLKAKEEEIQRQETQELKDTADAISQALDKAAIQVSGKVLSVSEDGVLLTDAVFKTPAIHNEVVYRNPLDGSVMTSPKAGFDYSNNGDEPIFVFGAKGLADGDQYSDTVYPAPNYSYTSVVGATKNVRAFAASKTLSIQLMQKSQ